MLRISEGLTVVELLAKIGGLPARTRGDKIAIYRDKKYLIVKVGKILDGRGVNIPLEAGDRVQAPFQGCFGGDLSDEELAKLNAEIAGYLGRGKKAALVEP